MLYEARAQAVQDYSARQLSLKEGLVKCKPTCTFAQILPDGTNEDTVTTPFGVIPKGSILSYQGLEIRDTKWQTSKVGRVTTTSCFGDVLLRCSLPTNGLISTFLM